MAIATTANLLLGLRCTQAGRKYIDSMVTQGGMDKDLCETAGTHMLIYMLPFAVELWLKGIRSQGGGGFIRTHNLESLWKDLDEAEQAEIRKRVDDPAWRSEERVLREALGITDAMRTVDRVIEVHQNDFEDWRYVVDGERNLTEEKEQVRIDEAIMDLYGIVYACVEYHKSGVGAQPFGCDEAAVGSLATVTAAGARSRHEIKGPSEVQDEVSRGEVVSVRAGLGPARGRDAVALCRRHGVG